MAVASSVVGDGTLSNTPTVLRTGAGTEHHVVTFSNTHNDVVMVTVTLNGVTPSYLELEAHDGDSGGFGTAEFVLGTGDTFEATASVDAVVEWSDEMDNLS